MHTKCVLSSCPIHLIASTIRQCDTKPHHLLNATAFSRHEFRKFRFSNYFPRNLPNNNMRIPTYTKPHTRKHKETYIICTTFSFYSAMTIYIIFHSSNYTYNSLGKLIVHQQRTQNLRETI